MGVIRHIENPAATKRLGRRGVSGKAWVSAVDMLGGLFAWVARGTAVGAQVLAALALLDDASWWNALYAAMAAIVAAWLGHECLASGRRAAREREWCANGGVVPETHPALHPLLTGAADLRPGQTGDGR